MAHPIEGQATALTSVTNVPRRCVPKFGSGDRQRGVMYAFVVALALPVRRRKQDEYCLARVGCQRTANRRYCLLPCHALHRLCTGGASATTRASNATALAEPVLRF